LKPDRPCYLNDDGCSPGTDVIATHRAATQQPNIPSFRHRSRR
jgi:hypothetical protein